MLELGTISNICFVLLDETRGLMQVMNCCVDDVPNLDQRKNLERKTRDIHDVETLKRR